MNRRADFSHLFGPLLGLLCYLLSIVFVSGLLATDIRQYRYYGRGVEDGLAIELAPPAEPRFGVNVSLEQFGGNEELRSALQAVRLAGLTGVRQHIPWSALEPRPGEYHWDWLDEILYEVQEHNLVMIAVLDTSPPWARNSWEADNLNAPPANLQDLASFASALAGRYAGQIVAYQIWDEPNIYPHWGEREIDPGEYVEMLRVTSAAIRASDPKALIIAGGLAPNLEAGGRNMSDVLFLREMYRRGAAQYFDVLGAKPYGFWSGPYDRRTDEEILNFSRVVLLREEMVARGDGHKPIWALEAGWAALPEGWQGPLPPQGSDSYLVQSQRLALALDRILQEWPWMGFACVQHLLPNAPLDDPAWGFSLLTPDLKPTPLYQALRESLTRPQVLYPGHTRDLEPYLQPWRASSSASLEVWGTDVYLEVEKGVARGEITITGDALAAPVVIALDAPRPTVETVVVATNMPLGRHRLVIQGEPYELERIRAIRTVRQQSCRTLMLKGALGGLLILYAGVSSWRLAALITWRERWAWIRRTWDSLPRTFRQAPLPLAFAAMALVPSPLARLTALAIYAILALLSPSASLAVAVACIPLAPIVVPLGPGVFSLAEISVLVAILSQGWNRLLNGAPRPSAGKRLSASDWAVLLLVILALIAALAAEYRHVAFRELRVVILESALMYVMVRSQPQLSTLRRLVDILWLSALGVAVYALWRYPTAEGVIVAEGVRRARGFYGSPNNLALYMERMLPLGLAMALTGHSKWRRYLYGLGLVPVGLALVLTFSRGALFIGLPAAILTLAVFLPRRWRRGLVGLLLATLLLAVPLMGPQRLASLFDPSQGTTFLRLQIWRASWDMALDHPILGVGPDNYLYYYGDYLREGAEVDRFLSHPHNLILDFWLRLGLGGPLLLIWMLVILVRQGLHIIARPAAADAAAMSLGFLGGVAAATAHGLIDAFFFVPELALWLLFVLGWMTRQSLSEAPPEPPETP